ncbi:hypothetical protein MHYP_G00021740 [Metynnis hypsauchen]
MLSGDAVLYSPQCSVSAVCRGAVRYSKNGQQLTAQINDSETNSVKLLSVTAALTLNSASGARPNRGRKSERTFCFKLGSSQKERRDKEKRCFGVGVSADSHTAPAAAVKAKLHADSPLKTHRPVWLVYSHRHQRARSRASGPAETTREHLKPTVAIPQRSYTKPAISALRTGGNRW